ncbi:MAG: phosphodiester glycosidase family protein [Chitinophagaceae bacterium]|nr:phosphodiester glycosidase family protein [Chitinophagaceae bacterium]
MDFHFMKQIPVFFNAHLKIRQKNQFIFFFLFRFGFTLFYVPVFGQLHWRPADSLYQPLPAGLRVFKTTDSLDGRPNIAFYVLANLKDKRLVFSTDTTRGRRLTPHQFFEKNNQPAVVMNGTFFSFQTNSNLNLVMRNGKILAYHLHTTPGRGQDTLLFRHAPGSAIGISKNRKADVAWIFTDSVQKHAYILSDVFYPVKNHEPAFTFNDLKRVVRKMNDSLSGRNISWRRWKMKTAIGGGPVLLQNGKIRITNNEELKFAGKAIEDRHPRTAMGYTRDQKLILLVVEGRRPGVAEGATLPQLARMLQELGCVEAINLDGGGSSCLLVNGRETIRPSDATGQRPVPAVFLISTKK